MPNIESLTKIIFLLSLIFFCNLSDLVAQDKKFVVYYTDKDPAESFKNYDTIVLDNKYHPPFRHLINGKRVILAYLSMGEVERQRSYFTDVEKENILIMENKDWPGSYYVDVRDKRWRKRVIEEIIPKILEKPFNGLFLDTLDNLAELERIDPKKYKGMTAAGVDMVKAIRLHFPNIKIMMNRGYELLPSLANIIDMELAESFYSDYNFDDKSYSLVSNEDYKAQLKILDDAKRRNRELEIYTLDYWYPQDKKIIKKIYKIQRDHGFIPYVSTIDLGKIISEPN